MSQSEKWPDWGYEEGCWAQGTNNKARPSGIGTTSWARRQRVQAAAQERDRLAAAGHADALEAQAKAAASKAASMKKQAEEAQEEAARIAEALEASRKKEKCPFLAKRKRAAKEKGAKKALQNLAKRFPAKEALQNLAKRFQAKEALQNLAKRFPAKEALQNLAKRFQAKEALQNLAKRFQAKKALQNLAKRFLQKTLLLAQAKLQILAKRILKKEQETLSKGTAEWKKKERLLPSPSPAKSQADWGRSSGSTSSSSSSSESSSKEPLSKGPTVLTMKPNKRIAVDWHGVLVINDQYNKENTECLESLKKAGYEVHLLSFCGFKRSQEVWNWAWHEWEGWTSVNFTWKRCGPKGKAEWQEVNLLLLQLQSCCPRDLEQGG
ncbi:unnamed protein product [Cladocopium goreaui]|uniref:Uncharacterized protein n=1 Tax=Cladocopium goreaui TaxID=2562237 RepID=A0A9P1GGY2_9DINO|nr:unnamed protein product [Cladocopium goreaui]